MPRNLRRFSPATPLLVLSLLMGLMSLPEANSHLLDLLRPTVRAATTFTVNSTGDGADNNLGDGACNDGTGACTLRAAMQEANTLAGDDAIAFAVSLNGGVITLNTALPDISDNLDISGPGANLLRIQRNSAVGTPRFRIFTIAGGALTVNIFGLTISNGHTSDGSASVGGDHGGAVLNNFGRTLNLMNVVISGNAAGDGGTGGPGSGSELGGYGGGIFNNGTVVLTNSSVTGNRTGNGIGIGGVGGAGGGIYNVGTLTVTNSTISGNITGNGLTGSGEGGGVFSSITLTISNSTISDNQTGNSFSGGGGIWAAGVATLSNSTISGNQANAYGGGLATFFGGTTLTNVTITNNRSGNFAGGLYGDSGTLTLRNSIVAGNFRGASPSTTADDISGMVDAASSFNLIGTGGSGGLANGVNNNQVGVADPRLGPLANNGGPTLTHALLTGSLAIDAANSMLTTDQRGQPRPVDDQTVVNAAGGNASDIGAFEAHTLEVNSIADADDGLCRPLETGNGCTLREAINAANAEVGVELVTFAPALTSDGPVTITLLTALANLSTDMTINGPGANLLTVQRSVAMGTPAFRIFTTTPGTTVTISGLTITNGKTADGLPAPVFGNPGDHGGGILNAGTLTLNDSVITGNTTGNGAPASSPSDVGTSFGGPGGFGGGIFSSGTLTMSNVTISNNTTGKGATDYFGGSGGSGAGIFLSSGALTMTSCVVTGNVTGRGAMGTTGGFSGGAGGSGAGISINSGTVQITNAIVSNNTTESADIASPSNSGSGGVGGGISIDTGNISIINSTITGNRTGDGVGALGQGGFGGGIFHNDALHFGALTVINSTISGNTTGVSTIGGGGVGGGVFTSGIATFLNSTISGNTTTGPGGFGGGFYSGASLTLTDCTITGNRAFDNSNGNGIYANSNYPSPNLANTVVAGNGTAGASDLTGSYNSQGHNLIGNADGSTGFNAIGDQIGSGASPLDARLGPLANNGGPTQTHALLAGSPALDAGSNAFVVNPAFSGPPFTDQRGVGFARIVDGPDADTTETVDIGAFEAQVSVADIADQTINEDGSLSLPFNVGGAALITSVTATSSNVALVPNNPANISISGSGSSRTLTINPLANTFGTSTITVTVNGSNSQQMTDTFLLTINAVNDAPSFTKGPDQTINENGGAQTVSNWATNISAGPANESGQTFSFIVANNSNPALFAVAPAISATGTLTYTPATNASGTALIMIALMDNGGTANGGVNTSATQSFNINVLEGGTLAFSAATYSAGESAGNASITITRSGGSAGTATVHFATSNGTATAADYTSVSQTVTFNNGEVSKMVNVAITDDLFKEADETVNLTLSNAGGSGQLGAQTTAVLTIVDNDPVGGYIRFSAANFNSTESSGSTTITVERVGSVSQAVTVNYATAEDTIVVPCGTANGIASSRCDFTSALGTLRFAAGENSKTFVVLISQDNYVEGPETLIITLSNLTGGAAFATPSTAILTIADDATEPATNPIDEADKFVRQHYHDFLNREPDASGLAFWTNQITECQQPGATCDAEVRRINVSAAFFLSIEFQGTGYLVERLYKSAYGDAVGTSTIGGSHQLSVPIIRFNEFLPDTQQIGQGVIVGQPGWETVLENNKQAFSAEFVQRSRFTTAYPLTMTPAQFVDELFMNTGVTPSAVERTAAIDEFGGAGTSADAAARGRALRRVAENATFMQQEFNRAFVLMQYFGYLRRNPNDPQDTDYSGYDFWLRKLNQFGGNFVNAEMVKAFILSGEYRGRFGP